MNESFAVIIRMIYRLNENDLHSVRMNWKSFQLLGIFLIAYRPLDIILNLRFNLGLGLIFNYTF